jgi:hypothetical protein
MTVLQPPKKSPLQVAAKFAPGNSSAQERNCSYLKCAESLIFEARLQHRSIRSLRGTGAHRRHYLVLIRSSAFQVSVSKGKGQRRYCIWLVLSWLQWALAANLGPYRAQLLNSIVVPVRMGRASEKSKKTRSTCPQPLRWKAWSSQQDRRGGA